jgi:hypothetical protein
VNLCTGRGMDGLDHLIDPVNDQRGEGGMVVQILPRERFNIGDFLKTRLVGLLPILWLALLLNAPNWGDPKTPLYIKATCSTLYVIGMQSWWRPTCHYYGPNNVLYASILLNCFIIYAVGRVLIITVQNHLMKWASKGGFSPLTLKPKKSSRLTFKEWVGNKVVMLSFNRTDMSTMLVMGLIWSVVGVGLFTVMLNFTYAKVEKYIHLCVKTYVHLYP